MKLKSLEVWIENGDEFGAVLRFTDELEQLAERFFGPCNVTSIPDTENVDVTVISIEGTT